MNDKLQKLHTHSNILKYIKSQISQVEKQQLSKIQSRKEQTVEAPHWGPGQGGEKNAMAAPTAKNLPCQAGQGKQLPVLARAQATGPPAPTAGSTQQQEPVQGQFWLHLPNENVDPTPRSFSERRSPVQRGSGYETVTGPR